MSKKSTNNYYITLYGPAAGGGSGDIEQALEDEVQELTGLVVDLEQERDNAILERDEAVGLAADLTAALSESRETVDNLTALRASDWEKLKSWNRVANEKSEEARKERLLADDWRAQHDRVAVQRAKAIQEMEIRGAAINRQEAQIEQLRKECANKRLQIKDLQTELDEADRERNAWKTRALERQERVEGLQTELIEAQNELDATEESGQYFADRTDVLTQQVKDLQDQLDEAKKFAQSWQDMYNSLKKQHNPFTVNPNILS